MPQVVDSGGHVVRVAEDREIELPYSFEVNEGGVFAFAGIWDCSMNASADAVETCSILTRAPNAVTASVDDRMPASLISIHRSLARSGNEGCGFSSELMKPWNARIMHSVG
jgi:hypothetical protein